MSPLFRLNALQNELRDVLSLSLNDYRLEVQEGDVRATFIGMQLHSVFQPIFNLDANIPFGYEALLRASDLNGNVIAPLVAFRKAEVAGKLVKFDRLCRTLHTLNYLNMGTKQNILFLNVHPELLVAVNSHGKIFEQVLHIHSLQPDNVVIEINESEVSDDNLLNDAIVNYRERGYRIAIDDFGKAHSNLNRLYKFSPAYVKFDPSIIKLAEKNDRIQRILPKLVGIIGELDAKVIIEGIETENQLELARHAGVHLVQGYFLGRPAPALSWEQADLTLPVAA